MNPQAASAPDAGDIQTEVLGFLALAGDSKLKLLPTPWPADSLPPPTSNLMSVASKKGLVAAAGPETLVIASTDAVRKAFTEGEGAIKAFQPQLSITIPRVNQVAFSADENYLAIAAEQGGGLAVYEVQAIMQGRTEPAFQLGTNGIGVRALVPNPAVEFAHFFSIVTVRGELLLANLKDKALVNGAQGPVMKEGVSCITWSAKGKRLLAGLGDGTAYQMTPEGETTTVMPRAPQLPNDAAHVSAMLWLTNLEYLFIYTPTSNPDPSAESSYFYVRQDKGTANFTFTKLLDPCVPFGMARAPAHFYLQRLKDFAPALTDMVIVSSTVSGDVGVFTRSETALAPDAPTNSFTTTMMADDSMRAALPSTESMEETSPIGMALDLSSKDKVRRPIRADEELTESKTPLPSVLILNNEGVLSSWWVVHQASVRQGTAYPGLIAAAGVTPQPAAQSTSSPFGASTATTASPFATSSTASAPAFGSSSAISGFGTASALGGGGTSSAFGSSGSLGQRQSPWASGSTAQPQPSAFGKPAFGSTSAFGQPSGMGQSSGSAFGSVGGLGANKSPWASQSTQSGGETPKANPFGGGNTASPFASAGTGSSGFSSFASTNSASPFASAPKPAGASIFGQKPAGLSTEPSFGSTVTLGSNTTSSFGAPSSFGTGKSLWGTPSNQSSSLGPAPAQQPAPTQDEEMDTGDEPAAQTQPAAQPAEKPAENKSGIFGNGSSGFTLGSAFKGDGTAKEDLAKPKDAGASMFGSAFGQALKDAPSTPIKKEPGTDEPKLSDIPETPQPKAAEAPKSTLFGGSSAAGITPSKPAQKTTKPPSPEQSPQVVPEEAPLPIDPYTYKGKIKDSTKDGVKSAPAPVVPEEAPLPIDPYTYKGKIKDSTKDGVKSTPAPAAPPKQPDLPAPEDLPAIAGSDPEDLADDLSSPLSEEKTPDKIADKTKPAQGASTTVPNAMWSFTPETKTKPAEQTPLPSTTPFGQPSGNSLFGPSTTTPIFGQAAATTTPFGLPKNQQPVFPPPARPMAIPRSPSPMRSSSTPAGPVRRTSMSPQRRQQQTPSLPPPSQQFAPPQLPSQAAQQAVPIAVAPGSRPTSRTSRLASQPEVIAETATQETADLEDEEDAGIRELLSSSPPPTLKLEPFVTHTDYAAHVSSSKTGIPGQIERVYKDINDMIDSLGLNARSLKAFIKGHEENAKTLKRGESRTVDDLDNEDDWCLVEIEDLEGVEEVLEQDLEQGRIDDVPAKVQSALSVKRDAQKLSKKLEQTRKQIQAGQDDMDGDGSMRPLSQEQATQLRDLKASFTEFQQLLVRAEESVSVLAAKVTSAEAAGSNGDERQTRAPTVEAVLNTIAKMTAMIEQKSGDIDVLEAQVRKFRGMRKGLAGLSLNDDADAEENSFRGSRGGSPFRNSPHRSPQASRSSLRRSVVLQPSPASTKASTYALYYSPEQSMRGSPVATREDFRSSLIMAPRKKLIQTLTDQEWDDMAEDGLQQRRNVEMLAEAIERRGPVVTKVQW